MNKQLQFRVNFADFNFVDLNEFNARKEFADFNFADLNDFVGSKSNKQQFNNLLLFAGNMTFRPREGPHGIRLEIPCCFMIFMCPEQKSILGHPSKNQFKICSDFAWLREIVVRFEIDFRYIQNLGCRM